MKQDIKIITHWECPEGTGVPLITMPNIPRPLHGKGLQPRTIFGKSTWDFMRKKTYFNADYKCEICGREPEKRDLHAHELFSYNYEKGTGEFKRAIAICRTCHDGIHSGRLLTMYKNGNPLYPKSYVLKVVENCFRLVGEYNRTHSDEEPLRVYATYLDYLTPPELESEVSELIEKYNIKFYQEHITKSKRWKGWKVLVGKNWYQSPYQSQADWEAAMAENNKLDTDKKAVDAFSGGVFDDIKKMLEED